MWDPAHEKPEVRERPDAWGLRAEPLPALIQTRGDHFIDHDLQRRVNDPPDFRHYHPLPRAITRLQHCEDEQDDQEHSEGDATRHPCDQHRVIEAFVRRRLTRPRLPLGPLVEALVLGRTPFA
jgi:hypothetical protein